MLRIATALHLLFVLVLLVSLRLVHTVIRAFYFFFPFPWLLGVCGAAGRARVPPGAPLNPAVTAADAAYGHSKRLRELFLFKFRNSSKPAPYSYDCMQLAASFGFRVREGRLAACLAGKRPPTRRCMCFPRAVSRRLSNTPW